MSLGENIKRIRKEKGMTQKELAERAGVTVITVQRYEQKKDGDSILQKTLEKIASALDTNTLTLLELSSPELDAKELIRDRKALNFSQTELASALGVDLETYQKYESGLVHVPQKVLDNASGIVALYKWKNTDYNDRVNTLNQCASYLNNKGLDKLIDYAKVLIKVPDYRINK